MAGMDPDQRRWWRLLEDLPACLGTVSRWMAGPARYDATGHAHTIPTMVGCLAGAVRVKGIGQSCHLDPGDVLVIAPGVWHEHPPIRTNGVFLALGFMPNACDLLLGDTHRRFHGFAPRHPSLALCWDVLGAEHDLSRRAACMSLLANVLTETIRDRPRPDPAVRRMMHRMWAGLHLGVRVDDLVRASGLSRAQAYRLFTRQYGMPPKAALESARVELADYLSSMDLPDSEIALRCGFEDLRTFHRAKRRNQPPHQPGVTPTMAQTRS